MQLFERKSSLLILLFCLPLLFLPKINILSLSETETAGLRIDDFILCGLFLVLIWSHLSLRKRFHRIEVYLLGIVAFSIFSFLSNRILVEMGILHINSKIFYCLRILEYFLFFYIGAMAAQFFKAHTILTAFFVWNLLLMVLQKVGILGEFSSSSGYNAMGSYRVSGISSFPSEMGALLNFIFCYYLFSEERIHAVPKRLPSYLQKILNDLFDYWLFFLLAFLTIITGSRIAVLALIVPFLFKIKQKFSLRSLHTLPIAICFLLAMTGITYYFIMETESIAVRSQGLLSWNNIHFIEEIWNAQDITSSVTEESATSFSENSYDLSWWMRLHKWCFITKVFCYNPECYLQGLGPGCAWFALDGGLLRILVENGLIGFFLYCQFFLIIARRSVQLRWMTVVFLINMIFFDTYLAYKVMSLLFLMTGFTYCRDTASDSAKDDFNEPKLVKN